MREGVSRVDENRDDDDFLDGCELDFTEQPTPDDEAALFALFAEALDATTPKTLGEAEADWKGLFSAGT